MALKMNYKDAMYDGQRRYHLVRNEDGTYSLLDATTYTQDGDKFGANDINEIATEVNRIGNQAEVTLLAANWSAEAPYSQRVAVPGIKSTDGVRVCLCAPKELDAAAVKLRRKLTGMITDGETEDGYAAFYCGEKKPTADFSVLLEGVSIDG